MKTMITPYIVICSVMMLQACGAPTKSAQSVARQFDAQGTSSVALKATDTLTALEAFLRESNISKPVFDLTRYGDAGTNAYDIRVADDIAFPKISYLPNEKSGDIAKGAYRGQFWLGRSFVQMASKMSKMLGNNKNTPPGQPVPMENLGDTGGLAKVAVPEIRFLEAANMDAKNNSFSAKFNIKVTGIANVEHDIKIDGKMFEHGVAVYVRTVGDQVFKKSILKNFSAMIVIIPHAQDTYLDFSIQVESYELGVDSMIHGILKSGIKGIISGGLSGLQ